VRGKNAPDGDKDADDDLFPFLLRSFPRRAAPRRLSPAALAEVPKDTVLTLSGLDTGGVHLLLGLSGSGHCFFFSA